MHIVAFILLKEQVHEKKTFENIFWFLGVRIFLSSISAFHVMLPNHANPSHCRTPAVSFSPIMIAFTSFVGSRHRFIES